MTPSIQVGTILIEDRPLVTAVLDLESESYSGNWSVVKANDGFALDLKIVCHTSRFGHTPVISRKDAG